MAEIQITETDTLKVDYFVTNAGGDADSQDIRLLVDGSEEDVDTGVIADPGAAATGTLSWTTDSGDAGTYTVAVASEDDTATASVEVVARSVDVSTGGVSEIQSTQATVGGELVALVGVDSVDVAVEYRQTGATTWEVEPVGTLTAPATFDATLTGLTGGTEYEARGRGDAVEHAVSDVGSPTTFTTPSAIPDSGVHQYVHFDATTSTWPDRVGNADLSGTVTDVTSSAVVTDGIDDILSTTINSISPPFSISAVYEITNTTKDFQNPWNLYPAGENGVDGNGYLFRNDQADDNFNVFGNSSSINYEQPANTVLVVQAVFRNDSTGELWVDNIQESSQSPSFSSYPTDEFGVGARLDNARHAEGNHYEYVIYNADIESAGVRQDEYNRLSDAYQ